MKIYLGLVYYNKRENMMIGYFEEKNKKRLDGYLRYPNAIWWLGLAFTQKVCTAWIVCI